MDADDYFKDFKLDDYRFIVVNKRSLSPLVWLFEDTQKYGRLLYNDNKVILKDPFDIAGQLKYYLDNKPKVPVGIKIDDDNSLTLWIRGDD